MIALNQRKMDMAHILLDSGVDLKVVDKNDENICFSIVRSHNLPLLKEIIAKNKTLLFSINYTRRNLLHEACMVKDHNIALYLLNNGLLANSADNFGETPIFFAAREKDYDMIKLLISYGAIIEKRNGFYETVLDIAKGEIHDYIEYQMQNAPVGKLFSNTRPGIPPIPASDIPFPDSYDALTNPDAEYSDSNDSADCLSFWPWQSPE
jgi:ankyrin repeat protein